MPGSGEVSRATHAAFSSGAPACGHRLSSAKNSPLTWNTTMSRPSTATTLLPPGGISDVRATMCRVMLALQLINRAGVARENLLALDLRQRRPEREARIVEIPVRVIRREQQAVDADPIDQRAQMLALIGLVDRLGREPEMLLHIFRRLALQMRHLAAERLEMPVHPPHRGRDPAEAAFDKHDLQFWETLGNTFEHQAGEHRRHGMRVGLMLLGIIRRPAAAGRRMPAIAADVDAERQAQLLRALIDRPVAAPPPRLVGARADIDLHIAAGFGAALDLGDCKLRIILAGEDRGFQPRIAIGPEGELPIV